MKTILTIVVLTVVFIASMVYVERKRTEGLNEINLQYQQTLIEQNKTDSSSSKDDEDVTKISVNITGAVKKPGVYEFDDFIFLEDVLVKAGGVTDDADSDAYTSTFLIDEDMNIYIPKSNNGNKISINSADITTLDLLPGIGITLATRIVEYREIIGEYQCIDQLKKVEGIGTSAFNKLKDYVRL